MLDHDQVHLLFQSSYKLYSVYGLDQNANEYNKMKVIRQSKWNEEKNSSKQHWSRWVHLVLSVWLIAALSTVILEQSLSFSEDCCCQEDEAMLTADSN